jgi:hypothetical protein
MTHKYNIIPNERNLHTIERRWPSPLDFSRRSNNYKLLDALTTSLDTTDKELEHVYAAQHIDGANGADLDKFGELVNVQRKYTSYGSTKYGITPYGNVGRNESDDAYRARIKANFRASTSTTTWDEFVEFCATVLDTNINNITFLTNYGANPATINVSAQQSIFNDINFTAEDIVTLLGRGVPAGHEVNVLEGGTFRLKEDGDADTAENGLTGDGVDTGGTLAGDVV